MFSLQIFHFLIEFVCLFLQKQKPTCLTIFYNRSQQKASKLVEAFKQLLGNNYPAACLAIGGVAMATGHGRITEAYGSCPVVILSGDTETGKTTVLRSALSLVGNDGVLKGR